MPAVPIPNAVDNHQLRHKQPCVLCCTPAGAYANLYHKTEVPGVFTSIWLSSYSPFDIYAFSQYSEQLVWLRRQLKMVDRNRTPWLIFGWHAPW